MGLTSGSDGGLDERVLVVLDGRDPDCEINEDSEDVRENDRLGGRDAGCDVNEASDIDLAEKAKLGGREACCEAPDDRLLEGVSMAGLVCLVLVSDNGLRNDTVLDLLNTGFSSISSGGGGGGSFFSGSLYSSLPFLSDAKYSSPRPNTTWSVAKSRLEPSAGKSHSWRAGGRSYPSNHPISNGTEAETAPYSPCLYSPPRFFQQT